MGAAWAKLKITEKKILNLLFLNLMQKEYAIYEPDYKLWSRE